MMEPTFKRWPRPKNLGDKVHAIAQPIARVIDGILKTDIQNCGACEKRRAFLNSLTDGDAPINKD